MTDEEYAEAQSLLQYHAAFIKGFPQVHDLLARANHAENVGSIFHPSEWMKGSEKLRLVIDTASAIAECRSKILKAEAKYLERNPQ